MKLIIQHSSMTPIYEQLVEQIKGAIIKGELEENDPLPSVRSLAKELKISALTVKKAYDALDQEGMIATVHGKGSFVCGVNPSLKWEEQLKAIQNELEEIVTKARLVGMSDQDLKELLELILEGS
ncbi:GntR family transcriptional regulator [Enterococcus hulanensis]|uniref:GntR family transcriptional regulator n=1 Tax=Enterococcus hulanensis TaxID=2559929 RepID=A0ABU3ETR6_9ENTE|nr:MULTISPECIES: GntR family transcriptional regulator [Enterococcus]MBO0410303.1 GntR family transcriptional regulator [Enterococcus hulanensis]MBX8936827.1 GntR family transcriptional regulator [Enterococcus gilvus]MDT2598258.1 GntR family transcriptional regulator [Enterococcus hulanensis]MDT2608237.1 GntR family transcriptional regulator [Enterococcus hulanensis]MDT2615532.1 GntR family transcriptional regulator [Enterococcus hulanensis]